MSQLVTLKLGWGNLQSGFPAVTALLGSETNPQQMQILGSLPPEPDLVELYKRWQLLYKAYYDMLSGSLRISFNDDEAEVVNFSELEFRELCDRFLTRFNTWLRSESFLKIREQLSIHLVGSEEIRVLIETEDIYLRRFPWNFWNFIKAYPQAEIALSAPEFKPVKNSFNNQTEKVRILALLGSSKGIDIQKDRELLQNFQDAKTEFLVEPSRNDIDNQLWEKAWDIFFFAGHSYGEIGIVSLDENRNLRIENLENALRRAIAQGLKLAIFNSCDGLGIASKLENWYIPQIIVMREPVPDLVAQEFLKAFLKAFASGKTLYLSVREARERLQGLEDKYPCASWLPVICQNPAEVPPTWNKLRGKENLFSWHNIKRLLAISAIATSLVMGVRAIGYLERVEQIAYDYQIRLRQDEGLDPRITIIKITEEDRKQQLQYPITDRIMLQLLKTVEQYQPQVIGLDIYREQPVEPGHKDLVNYLRYNKHLITICKVGDRTANNPDTRVSIPPPPSSPESNITFNDFSVDSDDVIRRHLFYLTPDSSSDCKANFAFNAELALRYLEQKHGIKEERVAKSLKLGKAIFKPLEKGTGFYHNLDSRGHQVLLNYRASQNVAREITLTQVLNNQFDPDWIKNRIVLIGAAAPESAGDYFTTPYSSGRNQKLPGVVIHAQMVSQFLDVALGKRPLLHFWPFWGDAIWIGTWSIVGGMLALYFQSSLYRRLAKVTTIAILFASCFGLLTQGICVPFIPAALVLVITSWSVVIYNSFKTQKS
ncbi:CHASE2 domain-containing protein [Aerosakkonema funiforme]|uniref:CHASE2 domain-containing protein n=1 Tax=Aerosakkonema funiforme TaxID=1246630 RepID=UPI0035B766C4